MQEAAERALEPVRPTQGLLLEHMDEEGLQQVFGFVARIALPRRWANSGYQ